MRRNVSKKMNSFILCVMLIVAMAITMVGCGTKKDNGAVQNAAQSSTEAGNQVLGEGKTKFSVVVVDGEGKETAFEIHTDEKTVGSALLGVKLIEGETGQYGLYVKKVNNITADYDVDKTYWAFYIDGEYASTGVDATAVEEGKTYTFKVEK